MMPQRESDPCVSVSLGNATSLFTTSDLTHTHILLIVMAYIE